MGINIVDLVIIGVMLLAIMYGWRWGTINVVARIGALVIAYQAARAYSSVITAGLVNILPSLSASAGEDSAAEGGQQLLAFLSLFLNTEGLTNKLLSMIVFMVIFVVVNWVIRKIAYTLTGIFGRGLLGKINRALGALISLVLMAAMIIIFNDIVLPACIDMGFGLKIEEFLQRSDLIMPLLMDLPSMV